MTFTPGYKRRKRTYSFRAYVDERGSNTGWKHQDHQSGRPGHSAIRCNCLKMWDVNRTGLGHNIIRITWGRGHLVILLGKKYHRIALRQRKSVYRYG
jgi:hypothetical protein